MTTYRVISEGAVVFEGYTFGETFGEWGVAWAATNDAEIERNGEIMTDGEVMDEAERQEEDCYFAQVVISLDDLDVIAVAYA